MNAETITAFIFGHSLSLADGDIIEAFIESPGAKTYIYYLDEEDRAEKIKNLAIILGAEQLIQRTNGYGKSIEFIKIKNTR